MKTARVMLQTEQQRIWGTVTYPTAVERLSDYINRGDTRYLSLTDVTVEELNVMAEDDDAASRPDSLRPPEPKREQWTVHYMAVNTSHVVLMTPLEESPQPHHQPAP